MSYLQQGPYPMGGAFPPGGPLRFANANNWLVYERDDYMDLLSKDVHAYNPFLHLWSLGVEEQFYIIAPILLYGNMKLLAEGKRADPSMFILLSAASIVFCWWADQVLFMFALVLWEMLLGLQRPARQTTVIFHACFRRATFFTFLAFPTPVWSDFYFKNDFTGRTLAATLYQAGFYYLVKHLEKQLDRRGQLLLTVQGREATWMKLEEADIEPVSKNRGVSSLVSAFGAISDFPIVEQKGLSTPGSRWARPSYFGLADYKAILSPFGRFRYEALNLTKPQVLTNEYEAWKILDADLNVITENEQLQMMMKLLPRKHIVHFSKGPCASHSVSTGGLLHVEDPLGQPFAQIAVKGCHAAYSLACEGGEYRIEESHSCGGERFAGPPGAALHHSWEICATSDIKLSTRMPLLDVTWNTPIETGTPVEGCIRVSLAEELPELASVRGTEEEQLQAIIVKKREVGGCPTYRGTSDRLARANDFEGSGLVGAASRQFLRLIQKELSHRAKLWSQSAPWSDKESLYDSTVHAASIATFLPWFGSNRTTAFLMCTLLNCGEPVPFIDSPMRFHYEDVANAQADPNQPRIYAMLGTPAAEDCHHPTLPLFQSSGSPEHTQWRMLLDEAGFQDMHQQPLTSAASLLESAWTEKIRKLVGLRSILPSPTELEVGKIALPLVFEGIWRKKMSSTEVLEVLPYLEFGKGCIMGLRGKHSGIVQTWVVKAAQKVAIDFARSSPTAEKLMKLIETPKFAALKKLLTSYPGSLEDVLLRGVIDASLFAGLLGTTDMATKCVQSQFKDSQHVMMFRKNPSAYLHELMRTDGAVTQFTTTAGKADTWVLEGHKVPFKADQAVTMVLTTANRDPKVFTEPDTFDPERANMGEMLTWNGKLKHVMARNYTGAPRFCPGYHLSVKVATDVCTAMTQDLNPWGSQHQESGKIQGLVKIKTRGWHGKLGAVAYYDVKKEKHCLTEKHHHDQYIGCFREDELEVVSREGGRPKTLQEEYNMCPAIVPAVMQMLLRVVAREVETQSTVGWVIGRLLGKVSTAEDFHVDWADDFTIGLYAGINLISMPMYSSRHADSVFVPKRQGSSEVFSVGNVIAPDVDIDHPHFVPVEWYIPQPLLDFGMLPGMTCFHGFLRSLPWDDMLDGDDRNTWDIVMNLSKFKHERKTDWVMSFYNGYKTFDGKANWPEMEVNLAQMYWKNDEWDDALERTIAFGLIASHRVEHLAKPVEFGGESLPFVIRLNKFHALEVRKNFGKYQGDLFFTKEGFPAMMELADGRRIARGDKDWQYWKFAWRCSLITVITLSDHLHMTHFRAANIMATAARKALSPSHPLRRLLSVFTFGSIFINLQAMHTLIGPRHVLHRSSPFVEFEGLSEAVPKNLEPLPLKHKAFLKEEEFQRLPDKLKEAPYFADGKLLFDAQRKLLREFRKLYAYGPMGFCSSTTDELTGPEVIRFRDEMVSEYAHGHYQNAMSLNATCTELVDDLLMASIWTVTGWHRHVGTVGDYYRDPELASFSWREGEKSARPLQHIQMTAVAVFTSALQPKLIEDYSHVFQGIYKQQEMVKLMDNFRAELEEVSAEVGRRNEKRIHDPAMGFKNIHADPKIVECSVAV
ncbi:cyp140 [Symbiodinium natans]|uniref:Cyp140 protein n=1 Tax=Symbiodinium natans TaxID=878477 RepID=A0A812SAI3_9DINO|nr:cyp140 [Symbiodinium natans]